MPGKLHDFIRDMATLVSRHGQDEKAVLAEGEKLLAALVRHDDWLDEAFTRAGRQSYRQYLLHLDPDERFCVVSFVWGPGQRTPIHDHTVWGMVGVMRGQELCREYSPQLAFLRERVVNAGEVALVSPSIGDIHAVSNPGTSPALSIHVYGANIGTQRRSVYDPLTGEAREFVSGYHEVGRDES